MQINGTHTGILFESIVLAPSKLFPSGETSQLFLYLVGTIESNFGMSSF
jgi:hypothetical protein